MTGVDNRSVTVESRGDVAVMSLDDGRANLIDGACRTAMEVAFEAVADADALVLAGRPGIFSAGLDLGELLAIEPDQAEQVLGGLGRLLRQAYAFPRPLVVACTGHAFGGGAVLCLVGDQRLGHAGVRLSINAARLGLSYPTAALEIARSALGDARAAHALLTGELVEGPAALAGGWLHELVESGAVVDSAVERATVLAGLHLTAYADTKRRFRAAALERIDGAQQADAQRAAAALADPDTRRQLVATLERLKRKV